MKWGVVMSFLLALPLWAQEASEDIRGSKPLVEIAKPEAQSDWAFYGLMGLLALLVIAMILWWLMRRRAQRVVSLEEWAQQELHDLQENGAQMKTGDFALAASGVVRIFVERKFGLAAPKRTTEEFLHELSRAENAQLAPRMEPLRGFLQSCDMAKFAGSDLHDTEREKMIRKAKGFVQEPEESQNKEALK